MPAYMIVAATLKDRQAFIEGYGKAAAELLPKFGGRYLLRAPGARLLEAGPGGWGDGASKVISEWPDTEAALRFWNSPEYAAARRLREGLAEVQVFLIEAPAVS